MVKVNIDTAELVNIAFGKATSVSSVEPSSLAFEPQGAVKGFVSTSFGFQTLNEVSPWWSVDLGNEFRLDAIVIYNRDDRLAATPDISIGISLDQERWHTVSRCTSNFGGIADGRPLIIHLAGTRFCRFIRISLEGLASLSLAEVEVYCQREDVLLAELFTRRSYSLSLSEGSDTAISSSRDYRLLISPDLAPSVLATGIARLLVVPFGRFGNNIIQLIHAVRFAQMHCVTQIDAHLINLPTAIVSKRSLVGETTIVFDGDDRPEDCGAPTLVGNFWDLRFSRYEENRLAEGLVAKHFLRPAFVQQISRGIDTLVLHVRSGDVFADKVPHPGYGQPPLSFYVACIEHRKATHGIKHVIVVYEDNANPVVEGLMKYCLKQSECTHFFQSSSLADDIILLMSAEHLVLSNGTFALVAGLLSQNLKTVMRFRDSSTLDLLDAVDVQIDIVVDDSIQSYISSSDWRNSTEQVAMILDYPEHLLRVTSRARRKS